MTRPQHGPLRPAVIIERDFSRPQTDIVEPGYAGAWILVRIFTEAVGIVRLPFVDGRISLEALCAAVRTECGPLIAQRLLAAGSDPEAGLSGAGAAAAGPPPHIADRQRIIDTGPQITVVICTYNHPENLTRTLDSLQDQTYRNFGVLVVDNAPIDDATERVVRASSARHPVEYVCEPEQGLSRARNRAIGRLRTPSSPGWTTMTSPTNTG